MKQIEKDIRQELSKITSVDISKIDSRDNLVDSIDIDSLTLMEMFVMIEESFKINLPFDKISKMTSIDNIVKIIEEQSKK